MDHFRKASESNKNIESIRCNECYQKLNHTDSNIIQARCSISHFLCKRCYDKTAKTSKKYSDPYSGWCNTCIWFDIG